MFAILRRRRLALLSAAVLASSFLPALSAAQESPVLETERIYSEIPFKEVLIVPKRMPGRRARAQSVQPSSDDPLSFFTPLTDPYQHEESGIAPTGNIPIDFQLAAVRVTKRDGSVVVFPPPVQSRAELAALLFGATSSLRAIVEEISWGQSSIRDGSIGETPIPDGAYKTIQVDLRKEPNRSEAFCYSVPAQRESGRGRYTFVSSAARDFFDCPWAAVTSIVNGGIFVAMDTGGVPQDQRDKFLRVVAHEHGHLLGLMHSHGKAINAPQLGKIAIEYGDPNCIMGFGFVTATNRVNAAQSYRLGWIQRDEILVLSEPGTYTVQITSADSGPGASLPSSVWIFREPREYRSAAPSLFVVSSSVQSQIFTLLSRNDSGWTTSSIPEGLIVQSVPLDNGFILEPPYVKGRPTDSGSFMEGTVASGSPLELASAGITVRLLARVGSTSTVEIEIRDLAGVFARIGLDGVLELQDILEKTLLIQDTRKLSDSDKRVLAALNRVIGKTTRVLRSTKPFSSELFRDSRRLGGILKDMRSHASRANDGSAPSRLSVRKLKADVTKYLELAER